MYIDREEAMEFVANDANPKFVYEEYSRYGMNEVSFYRVMRETKNSYYAIHWDDKLEKTKELNKSGVYEEGHGGRYIAYLRPDDTRGYCGYKVKVHRISKSKVKVFTGELVETIREHYED